MDPTQVALLTHAPTQPARTKKRRRCWLIVVSAFMIALAVVQWYWPRVDARFVGTWAGWKPGHQRPRVFFHFASNGVVTQRDSRNEFNRRVPWRVAGQHLMIGYEGETLGSLADVIGAAIYQLTGQWPVAHSYMLNFKLVDQDTIQTWRSANDIMTLRRIPE